MRSLNCGRIVPLLKPSLLKIHNLVPTNSRSELKSFLHVDDLSDLQMYLRKESSFSFINLILGKATSSLFGLEHDNRSRKD